MSDTSKEFCLGFRFTEAMISPCDFVGWKSMKQIVAKEKLSLSRPSTSAQTRRQHLVDSHFETCFPKTTIDVRKKTWGLVTLLVARSTRAKFHFGFAVGQRETIYYLESELQYVNWENPDNLKQLCYIPFCKEMCKPTTANESHMKGFKTVGFALYDHLRANSTWSEFSGLWKGFSASMAFHPKPDRYCLCTRRGVRACAETSKIHK